MSSAYDNYFNNVNKYNSMIKEHDISIKRISYLRLITFIIGVGTSTYTFFRLKAYSISFIEFILSLFIFIYLVFKHDDEIKIKNYLCALREVNERGLKRLNGQWKSFDDNGAEFNDINHRYGSDLDILGQNSLYQYINSTTTFTGKQILIKRLLNPLKDASDIRMTQEALKELAFNLKWRQEFEAKGIVSEQKNIDPENLYKWGNKINEFYTNKYLIFAVRLLPFMTITLYILCYFTKAVSIYIPIVMTLVQIIILFAGAKERREAFDSIYSYKESINIYFDMLKHISKSKFKSGYLTKLKENLTNEEQYGAVEAINKLSKIYDKMSDRNNAIFIIINILLLWDYQCMIQFEQWKSTSGSSLKKWIDTIGEFEALSSICNVIYENPNWTMPLISERKNIVKGNNMGHPLLNNRVCNDISIDNNKSILLITGSNMSGKSTFLRTVGINLILSYIGCSVCADSFECSIMEIFTCMRISDNLENNISSFYGEILRVKLIVESTKNNDNIFFLLDELFKGTNSKDRHAGAEALIRQLGNKGACGLISTHDLELSSLEYEYSKLKNYHFEEYYENNKLKFDYKIRRGVSTTSNAMYLIKMVGIEIE